MTIGLAVIDAMQFLCLLLLSYGAWRDGVRLREIERRLNNTFVKSPGPRTTDRQRTSQGEKGAARQSHVQIRGSRNNNPER